jgi:hypothetical protein
MLAGLAAGLLSRDDLPAWTSIDRTIQPRSETRTGHDRRYAAFRELYRTTREVVHALGDAGGA